ncbi:MAG: hypothetical protein Q4G60_10435 [bacterium]|nr:hypothetical protein [bacterium]
MNAYAMKPSQPFIAKTKLERTPASEMNKKMVEFIDSHNFSVNVDQSSHQPTYRVTRK